MNSSFFHSRWLALTGAGLLLAALATSGHPVLQAGLIALALLTVLVRLVPANNTDPRMAALDRVVRDIAAGKVSSRITGIGARDTLGTLCWHLNNMLDQLETCFREQQTTLAAASRGHYQRRAMATGLHGEFRAALERTNISIQQLEDKAREEAALREREEQARADIRTMVAAVRDGDFGQRIPVDGKEGFFLALAEDLNALSSGTGRVLEDVAIVLDAIARGDLSRRIDSDYHGVYGKLKNSTNRMADTLQAVVGQETAALVNAAAHGDFSQRIAEQGKEGFYLELARELNMLCATTEQALNDIATALDALARGDLTRQIERHYEGIFEQIRHGTNHSVSHLHELVSRIADAADAINIASREIAAGNQNLSTRTESQAASLEETASSMEELSATLHQTAGRTQEANALSRDAAQVASEGGRVMQDVIRTMQAIDASAHRIESIISVIDGIAFQTNILALNAAVEAARAGDAGRGFAVVAGEVRHLAGRAADAAREVRELIATSLENVDSGSALATSAGNAIGKLVGAVERVRDIVDEVSATSKEQSTGIAQVNLAVASLDETTQQNAALVEQAAAAAESMADQADGLSAAIATFRLRP